jgi:hypothetical protein
LEARDVDVAGPGWIAASHCNRSQLAHAHINIPRGMPSWAQSDDAGDTSATGGVFLQLPTKVTPYVKYAGDGRSTVHLESRAVP